MDARHSLTLTVLHPSRKADEVTAALRIDPDRCWDKGAACNTPDGRPLPGRHKDMYWRADLAINEPYRGLAAVISDWLDRMDSQRDFIREFADSGGEVWLEIYWNFAKTASDDRLPRQFIDRLAAFGIGLHLCPTY